MYIEPITGIKVLYFGVTKDRISTFVIQKFTHNYFCSLSHKLAHKQNLTFCESVFFCSLYLLTLQCRINIWPVTVVFATVRSHTEGGCGDEMSSSCVHGVVNMTCVVAILP